MKIMNIFLLVFDIFVSEIHLKQPWFTCSACVTFPKNKERIQKLKETGDSRCSYYNKFVFVIFFFYKFAVIIFEFVFKMIW